MDIFNKIYINIITEVARHFERSVTQVELEFNQRFICELFHKDNFQSLITKKNFSISIISKCEALMTIVKTYELPLSTLLVYNDLLLGENSLFRSDPKPQNCGMEIDSAAKPAKCNPPKIKKKKISSNSVSLDAVLKNVGTKKTRFDQKSTSKSQSAIQYASLKALDKHQALALKQQLLLVEKKYPHYDCNGCDICEKAFKNLAVTRCSKKHGGNPCNQLGMYPHASKTWLAVAHTSKKITVWNYGFKNPLQDSQDLSSDPETSALNKQNHKNNLSVDNNISNRTSSDKLSTYRSTFDDTIEERDLAKQRNAVVWKLNSSSGRDHFELALKRFTNLKRSVPGFQPPTWATGCSKALFTTLNVLDAKAFGQECEKRRAHRNRRMSVTRITSKKRKH